MVRLIRVLSVYLFTLSLGAVLGIQTTPSPLGEWMQTPKSDLPVIGNEIASELIDYYQENDIDVESVGVPRIIYCFQRMSDDNMEFDTFSEINIDDEVKLCFITINKLAPSSFLVGEVECYPCVKPYHKHTCSASIACSD